MDNHGELLDALTALGKNPNPQEIPSLLEQFLKSVAKTGETLFPWTQLKPLILRKMELVILELKRNLASENIPNRPNVENVRFDVMHARIIDALHKFNGAPFTIQRLCELLIEPKRHYKRSDKFMRGLEKNVLVVSTVDPFGRKVVCEAGNKPVLNGILDVNGAYPLRDGGLSVPLPPVPGWVNTPASANNKQEACAQSANGNTPSNGTTETNTKDCEVSNSETGVLAGSSSVYAHQGDSLSVQSEEVVEETVVTMETGEVSSDAGEAMADRDSEEMPDDREASSFSSSSSSSSEELSSSDSATESNVRVSPVGTVDHNVSDESPMDDNRPWAAFAQSTKPEDMPLQFSTTTKSQPSINTTDGGVSSSSLTPLQQTSSSSPTHAQSPSLTAKSSHIGQDDSDMRETSDNQTPQPQQSTEKSLSHANQSSDFETVNTDFSDLDSTALSNSDVVEKDNSITTTTTEIITTTKNTLDPSPSNIHVSSSQTESVPTYAQVVASSTSDSSSSCSSTPAPSNPLPFDSTDDVPCDSVAGLERLVGSMEQSQASSSSATTSSPSSLMSQPLISVTPATSSPSSSAAPESSSLLSSTHTNQQVLPQISTSECSSSDSNNEEPVCKRMRMSVDGYESSKEADCISTSCNSSAMEEDSGESTQIKGCEENLPHKQVVAAAHSSDDLVEGDSQSIARTAGVKDDESEDMVVDGDSNIEHVEESDSKDKEADSKSSEVSEGFNETSQISEGNAAAVSTTGGEPEEQVVSEITDV